MLLFLSIIEKRSESRTKRNLIRSQTETIVLKTCSKRILFCKSRLDLQKSKLNSHKSKLNSYKPSLVCYKSNLAFYFFTRSEEKINRKSDLFRPLYNNFYTLILERLCYFLSSKESKKLRAASVRAWMRSCLLS